MSEQDMGDVREGVRDSMLLLVMISDVQGDELGKAIIRNISCTGMLVEGDLVLKEGQIVRFQMRNIGELSGEVMRIEGGRIGIHFHREIDPLAVRRPVAKAVPPRASP